MGTPLDIYQYQAVNFTSTSVGSLPLTLTWTFPGGEPSVGSAVNETVYYNVPGNYTVFLTATDSFGTVKTREEVNIIRVSASNMIPGISGPSPSTVKMNEGYDVYDGTIPDPFPPISWYWQLPYGITASTQNVGVTGYVDWNILTGGYTAAPGSTYTGDIYLSVNNGYVPGSATTTVDVQKLGPPEPNGGMYMNATGPNEIIIPGLSGGILVSSLPPYFPITADTYGYPGADLIVKLNFFQRVLIGSDAITTRNRYFHSTNESASIFIRTGLWTDAFLDPVTGYLIINGPIYTSHSTTISPNDAINYGQYIIEYQAPEFFIGVSSGLLNFLYTSQNYSTDLLSYLITNPYKLINSSNIQYINYSNPPSEMYFIDPNYTGASGGNPMVYSSYYLQNIEVGISNFPIPANPVYEVYLTVSFSGFPYGATASFGVPGSTGNDPLTGGNFFCAQDNSNGPGFVSYLNSAINASIPGGTGSIDFVSNSIFSVYSATGSDPSSYPGIAMRIISSNVSLVTITDNSTTINASYPIPLTYPIAPFTADILNSQGALETCVGTFPGPIGNPPYMSYNVLSMGGSIVI